MKAYTDIEQSKVLAEILPIESADMYYCYSMDIKAKEWSYDITPTIIDEENKLDIGDISCWSLAALLESMPYEIDDNHFLTVESEGNEYCCCYEDINGNSFRHEFADNPIDACVEMVVKLHEKGLI